MTRRLPTRTFFLVLTFTICLAGASRGSAGDSKQAWVEVRSPHFTVASDAGEKQARKIADQFEQFRAIFHGAFGKLRVDPSQPIVILAAKNEGTMKELLPEEYEVKGHIHHWGLYQAGMEKHYVILRLDASGDNPFHTLYHEYTHALLHMNFDNLPVWLDEGLAEFYGNSELGEKEVKVGVPDPGHLYLLQQNRLLPIDVLLGVDHRSPYYNEANRASVFYAESWALVHYIMLDKEARDKQLLTKFITSWSKSGNQLDAAREAFGDLKRFGEVLSGYARQRQFYVGNLKPAAETRNDSFVARSLSPGEALALRGDFCTHKNRFDQAEPLLQQAVQLEPKLAIAHENLGICYYYQRDAAKADEEVSQAMQLGASDFIVLYLHGLLVTQHGSVGGEGSTDATDSLEKATKLNPQFAPAYEALAQAYSRDPANRKKAIATYVKAVDLEPGNRFYRLNLAYLLMIDNQDDQAQKIGEGLLRAAQNPQEEEMARDLLARVAQHQQWETQARSIGGTIRVESTTATTGFSNVDAGAPVVLKHRSDTADAAKENGAPQTKLGDLANLLGVDGMISEVDCSKSPEVRITLELESGPLVFHAQDFGKVEVSAGAGLKVPELKNCKQWPGRQAKIWFHPAQGKKFSGEMTKVHFF